MKLEKVEFFTKNSDKPTVIQQSSGSQTPELQGDADRVLESSTRHAFDRAKRHQICLPYCPPKLTAANKLLANQLSSSIVARELVRLRSRSVLLACTITNGNALILSVYVKVSHCQCTQMFLSLFHSDEKSAVNGKSVYMLIVISTE